MGFWRDLLNRIRGVKPIAEKTEVVMPGNSLNQYSVDPSSLQAGKTNKDIQIEKAIEHAKLGYNLYQIKDELNELTPLEMKAIQVLGYDLSNNQITEKQVAYVGGSASVIQKMVANAEQAAKENQYMQSEAYRFVESGYNTVLQMIEIQTAEEYKNSFKIQHKDREPILNQLYNSALELGELNNLTEEDLLKYASERGGRDITLNAEEPAIESVDVSAVISLAKAKLMGVIDDKTIEDVGGPIELINEMSAIAKLVAKDDNRTMDKAKEYLEHPITVAGKMPKHERDQIVKE